MCFAGRREQKCQSGSEINDPTEFLHNYFEEKSVSMAEIHTHAFCNFLFYHICCSDEPALYKTVSASRTMRGIVATASIVDRANISEE